MSPDLRTDLPNGCAVPYFPSSRHGVLDGKSVKTHGKRDRKISFHGASIALCKGHPGGLPAFQQHTSTVAACHVSRN